MITPSIFTRIITGEIPAYKIYEDDTTLAFLDIHPSQPGHVLVIPKRQVAFIWDLEPEDYQAVMATAQRVGAHLREVLAVPYVGMKVVGVDVPHAHVHLIPFSTVDDYRTEGDMTSEPEHTALAAMHERLRMT